ncbi:MAG: hypothetical protein IPM76_26100 [Chloroflexi bacterium]|nr:hypothetical protein [Chloroflexota bacterium]
MKIAVVTDDGKKISAHFGRATKYAVYTVEAGQIVAQELRAKMGHQDFAGEAHHDHEHHHETGHGQGQHSAEKHQRMFATITDCDVLLARGMGQGAYTGLEQANVRPILTDIADVETAVTAVIEGKIIVFSLPASAQEQETEEPAVVHAVLFYSPTCPHCHEAINNVMIPLMEKYGEQLAVLAIDTTTEAGSYLFTRAITYYQTPQNRQGVPTLVIEDTVLVGALEIENVFPEMIEAGLAAGGNNWPNFPGMAEIVMELTPAPDSAPAEEAAQTQTPVTEADGAVSADVATAVPLPSLFPSAIAATEDTTAQSFETIDAAAA